MASETMAPEHSALLGRGTAEDPARVGALELPHARVVHIVHISDTHMTHHRRLQEIPPGDILIHSGDFLDCNIWQEFERDIKKLDEVFASLPHKYKIFVAGNHEICFNDQPVDKIKHFLPHGIYLQDEGVVIEGIKIHGSPWNGDRDSPADAFVAPYPLLGKYWELIPRDTEIVVTHNPPFGIYDNDGGMGCPLLLKALMEKVR